MRTYLNSLAIALFAAGLGGVATSATAETRFYDPSNIGGNTTGYEIYRTIGCPGRQLLDPPCNGSTPPKPVAKATPAPAPAPKPVTKEECMANAKPGECYVLIVKEPVYRTEQVQKLVKEAGERIEIVPPVYKAVKVRVTSEEVQEVVPAVYETVTERVVVRPATTRLETVPAVFEEVEERVMAKPASKNAIEVPAVYEDVIERKLVREAYTTWKPGTSTSIQRIDEKTGEIFCLVEMPAEYQEVTTRVLKTPASIRYEDVPAQYQTAKRTVLKTPETTRTVEVPAEYGEREVTRLVKPATTTTKIVPVDYEREVMTEVQPATEKRVPVPAEYAAVEQKVLVTPAAQHCTRVLCDVNATKDKMMEIQRALQTAGYYQGGPIDGEIGASTTAAVTEFQKAKGLTGDGYLTIETVRALGVSAP